MEFYKIKNENNKYYSYDNKKITEPENINIADPSYDLTFKSLFSKVTTNGVTWEERIISLLSSLFISEKIEEIILLNNEHIKTDSDKDKKENLSLLKSELVFRIKLANTQQIVNIEMQEGVPENEFLDRLINYGRLVRNFNEIKDPEKKSPPKKMKTIVIGFLNSRDSNKKSNFYTFSEFDISNQLFKKRIDNFIEIVIINLKDISAKLDKNEDIVLLGKKISTEGKNWLKLLSIRHWGISAGNYKFMIPKLNISSEMDSAISYLKDFNDNKMDLFFEADLNYQHHVKEVAKEMAEDLANQKTEKLSKDIETLKESLLTNFLTTYKSFDLNLDNMEKIYKINLSDFELDKIEKLWGNDKNEKLGILKNFINKKRKAPK